MLVFDPGTLVVVTRWVFLLIALSSLIEAVVHSVRFVKARGRDRRIHLFIAVVSLLTVAVAVFVAVIIH